jgi:hypothetical protein
MAAVMVATAVVETELLLNVVVEVALADIPATAATAATGPTMVLDRLDRVAAAVVVVVAAVWILAAREAVLDF